MTQNRNKLIKLFISNISNSIVHEILERAINEELIIDKYRKEIINSLEIAKKYREKINPADRVLSNKDIGYIRAKIINKVKSELMTRISKGYKNINLNLIDELVNKFLKDMNIA